MRASPSRMKIIVLSCIIFALRRPAKGLASASRYARKTMLLAAVEARPGVEIR